MDSNEEVAMQLQRKLKEFQIAAKSIFNTDDGKRVLATLKDDYVERTAVGETSEITYYKLGQKELVQSLVRFVENPEELDEIVVHNQVTTEL